jgi:hypothetical protein
MSPLITVQTGPRNARTDPESGIRYYTWQGKEYPSVTSIRNLAGLPIKLAVWRTNQVIDRAMVEYQTLGRMIGDADPKAVASWLRKAQDIKRDAAADLGKAVHDDVAVGRSPADVPPERAPFLLQYRNWLMESGFVVELQERQVWSPTFGYAGTFDTVGRFPKRSNEAWLIDLKTGSGTYPEHALQTEAYARTDFVGEDDVEDKAATRILKQVAAPNRAVLHLRPDGWSFKTIPGTERTWNAFLGLLTFATWVDANPTLDGLIGGTKEGHV